MLPGPVAKDEVPRLCDDVRARLETTGSGVVVCDVAGLGPPGLGTVDLLARLELAARRAGGRIRLRNPSPALRALLDLVGLRFDAVDAFDPFDGADSFGSSDPVGTFEPEGQSEEREPAGGVQEAVEPGDPAL